MWPPEITPEQEAEMEEWLDKIGAPTREALSEVPSSEAQERHIRMIQSALLGNN